MGTAYTNCDIEIHLSDYTEGLVDTELNSEIDEDATQDAVESLVRSAVEAAYPDASVAIYSQRHTSGADNEVVRYPDDVDPRDILEIIADAVDVNTNSEQWIITRATQDAD